MAENAPTGSSGADFAAAMREANVSPLWERYQERHDNNQPRSEPAFHWPWRTLEPLIDRAVEAASTETAERRVMTLANPGFGDGARCATTNLNAGIQILMPGEMARPHRHSMNALRFVIEGSGAVTVVDGKPCPMEAGDMILTPAWTWHEHVHEGTGRVVWLDSLDVPLVDHLGAAFFEPGPTSLYPDLAPDSAFTAAGLMPQVAAQSQTYSPLFRYPWKTSADALAATPQAPDGSRKLRYVNLLTGGPVMSLLDCYLLGLPKGSETAPYRTTSNAVCFVAEGEGVSHVGDDELAWVKNDVFTLPHWKWISHRAASAEATLFMITDWDVMRRLELLRDETRD